MYHTVYNPLYILDTKKLMRTQNSPEKENYLFCLVHVLHVLIKAKHINKKYSHNKFYIIMKLFSSIRAFSIVYFPNNNLSCIFKIN